MTETERRFLVPRETANLLAEFAAFGCPVIHTQGYICADETRTVRVRTVAEWNRLTKRAGHPIGSYITLKGKKDEQGSGEEIEGEIPHALAVSLLTSPLCLGSVQKVRYTLACRPTLAITLDEFMGGNRGLFIMEVEGDPKAVAAWDALRLIEVTQEHRFSCSQLAQHPYQAWYRNE